MESPIITIVGYLNIDINRYSNKPEVILPGGAAYFVAKAAAARHSSVAVVTSLGTDFPIETLGSHIRLDGALKASIPASKSIQTYYDINDSSKRNLELFDGAAQLLKPEDVPEQWIQESKWIHIATMPPKIQLPFLKYLREKKSPATISVDTDYSFLQQAELRPVIEECFSLADVVFMNRYEYEVLKDDISKYPTVIVKKDADGALLFKNGKQVSIAAAPKTECLDATGAGDIFAGTYIAEITNGSTEVVALQKAVQQATFSVSKVGIDHLPK